MENDSANVREQLCLSADDVKSANAVTMSSVSCEKITIRLEDIDGENLCNCSPPG